jgi:hypothetical protein
MTEKITQGGKSTSNLGGISGIQRLKEEGYHDTLKPITKAKSKEDKELQEWEVESTGGGLGAGGG